MRYLLFLIFICIGYYYYRKYNEPIPKKYDCYMGLFVVGYLLFYYSISNHPEITYKFANNLKNVHNQPLYSLMPDFKIKNNPYKTQLLMHQNYKCNLCNRPISFANINNSKVVYKNFNLHNTHNINNMQVVCPNCFK